MDWDILIENALDVFEHLKRNQSNETPIWTI